MNWKASAMDWMKSSWRITGMAVSFLIVQVCATPVGWAKHSVPNIPRSDVGHAAPVLGTPDA
jgi:hypothetical protein